MVKEHLDVEKVMKNYLRVALSIFNVLKKKKFERLGKRIRFNKQNLVGICYFFNNDGTINEGMRQECKSSNKT